MTGRKHQATLPSLPSECSNAYARTTGDVQGSAVAPATITSTALGIVGHLNRDSVLDTRFAHRGSIWALSRARWQRLPSPARIGLPQLAPPGCRRLRTPLTVAAPSQSGEQRRPQLDASIGHHADQQMARAGWSRIMVRQETSGMVQVRVTASGRCYAQNQADASAEYWRRARRCCYVRWHELPCPAAVSFRHA